MIDERWVYLALPLQLAGAVHYIWMIRAGTVRPNRASWLMWTIAPAVVLAAEIAEGVGLRVVMTIAITLGPLAVLVASYATKGAYWRLGAFDYACGGLSGVAIVLWAVTSSAVVAIVLSILADALAAIPTVRKAMSHPESENPWFFVSVALGGGLTMLTVQRWTFADWAFPLYILLFPAWLAGVIWWRQRRGSSGRPALVVG